MSNRWPVIKHRLETDPVFAQQYREQRRADQKLSRIRKMERKRNGIAAPIKQVKPPEVAPVITNVVNHIYSPELLSDQVELLQELLGDIRDSKQNIRTKDEHYREQLDSEVEALNVLLDWLDQQEE